MKRLRKLIACFVITVIVFCCPAVMAFAETVTQDGLQAEIVTDKDSYVKGEDISVTVTVKNTNDYAVENVSIEGLLPDNLKLKDKSSLKTDTVNLEAGQTLTLSYVAILNDDTAQSTENTTDLTTNETTVVPTSSLTTDKTTEALTTGLTTDKTTEALTTGLTTDKTTGTITTVSTTDKTTGTTATATTIKNTVLQPTSITTVTTSKNNSNITTNSNGQNNSSVANPKTGVSSLGIVFAIISGIVAIAILIFTLKNKKIGKNFLSVILCFMIALSSVSGAVLVKALTTDNDNRKSFTVSKTITVNGNETEVKANVEYEMNISDDEKKLEDGFLEYFEVKKDIEKIKSKYENSNGYINIDNVKSVINDVSKYAEEKLKQDKIQEYNITDNESVWIKLKSGVEFMFIPKIDGVDSIDISTYQPCLKMYSLDIQNRSIQAVDGSAENIEKYVEDYNFTNNYNNEDITLDTIKNIGDNQVVIWHGHGAYDSSKHSCLLTSIQLDEVRFLLDPIYYIKKIGYTEDYLKGNIVCSDDGHILVTAKFFEKYLTTVKNSFIYLGACSSGKDSTLAEAFIQKGAEAVIANTDVIHTEYNLNMIESICNKMTNISSQSNNYYTLGEALEISKKKNGYICCSVHPNTEVKLWGNDNYRYSMLIGSITGRVKEQGTNSPISNREVKIYNEFYTVDNAMYTFIDKTKTDSNGSFKFSLPAGTYTLVIDNDGENANSNYHYDTVEMKVKVEPGVDTVLLNDIVLALRENGITGYVYDNDDLINNAKNTPIADVTVEVYQNNNGTTEYIGKCKTDENGKYTFAVDKNGSYDLSFIKSGYEDKTENMVFVNGGFTNRDVYLIKGNSSDNNVKFAGGDGTEANPYQVSTPEQLNAVRNDLSAHYIQINDIDMSDWGNWEPIGTNPNMFSGVYNGSEYKINNLTIIYSESNTNVGLFGYAPQSTIKNINMIDCNIEITNMCDFIGSIVGYGGTVFNCSTSGSINSYCYSGGGIAGIADVVKNCTYNGELNFFSNSDFTYRKTLNIDVLNMNYYPISGCYGGIVGICNEISIAESKGSFNVSCLYQTFLGGIAGYSETISRCYNTASLKLYTNGSASYFPEAYVGGISGVSKNILDSYNIGDIMVKSQNYSGMVGGITGMGYGNYSYCYNVGTLTNNSKYSWYKGGIIGLSPYITSNINDCYSNISVLAGSGNVSSKVKYINSIYLDEEKFKIKSSFENFDFENIWEISINVNYGYPYLQQTNA